MRYQYFWQGQVYGCATAPWVLNPENLLSAEKMFVVGFDAQKQQLNVTAENCAEYLSKLYNKWISGLTTPVTTWPQLLSYC